MSGTSPLPDSSKESGTVRDEPWFQELLAEHPPLEVTNLHVIGSTHAPEGVETRRGMAGLEWAGYDEMTATAPVVATAPGFSQGDGTAGPAGPARQD